MHAKQSVITNHGKKKTSDNLDDSNSVKNELESLYTACLEWILDRQGPQSNTGAKTTLMIDDYDKISFEPAL